MPKKSPPNLLRLLEQGDGNPLLFGKEILKETPHEKQIKLINKNKLINLILTGNRFGKTRGIAQKHANYLQYKYGLPLDDKWAFSDYKTLNCSYEYNTAQKVFDNLVRLIRTSPFLSEGGPIVRRIDRKGHRIELQNNSEFHFASLEEGGKHIEGEAYRYISVDEAGWVKNLKDVYENVLLPRTMGVGGFVDFIGTPKPDTDPWLEELWVTAKKNKDKNISIMQGSTYDNPYLNKAQIKQIENMYKDQPAKRLMVIEGKFIQKFGKLLTPLQIRNAVDKSLPCKTDDQMLMWGTAPYVYGHRYVSFWDMAFDSDWTVGCTLDITEVPYRQVNYTRVNKTNVPNWNAIFNLMRLECRRYRIPFVWFDATGMAGGVLEETLAEKKIPCQPYKTSTKAAKDELIHHLELAFSYRQPVFDQDKKLLDGDPDNWGKVRIPNIEQEIKELSIYHRDDKKIPETDSVIALAGALAVAGEFKELRSGYLDLPDYFHQERTYIKNPIYEVQDA